MCGLRYARLIGAAWLFVAAAIPAAQAQANGGNESLVTSQRDLIDFEFSQSRAAMTWCDKDGKLWTANVDPVTGLFVPSNGKGTLVDADAMTTGDLALITNGPEWVGTAYGDQIVYTKFVSGQAHTLANARLALAWQSNRGAWSLSALSPNLARNDPYASHNEGDPQPTITYVDAYGYHYWRNLYDATTETRIPLYPQTYKFAVRLGEGPRVAAFVTPVDGVQQVFIYWLDTGETDQITFDSGQKDLHSRPWIWQAPEYNGDLVMETVVDDTEMRIYHLPPGGSAADWQVVDSVSTPDGGVINSPEHFVYNGKSYVFFASGTPTAPYPSAIYLTGIDADQPSLVQLTPDDSEHTRTDPEVFIANDGPYIYYNRGTYAGKRTCLSCNEGVYRTYTGLSASLAPPRAQ